MVVLETGLASAIGTKLIRGESVITRSPEQVESLHLHSNTFVTAREQTTLSLTKMESNAFSSDARAWSALSSTWTL